ncbi:MAG: YceI family protein [Planctomycetes bacterium]|nr:YceI family protein [Planctomycetota bacterium]
MATGAVKHGILQGSRGRGSPVFLLLLLLSLGQASLGAEYTVHYEPAPGESTVELLGTSNLHDWTIKGTVIEGYVDVNETCQLNPKVQELSGLSQVMASVKTHAEIPVPSLKSGHSGMDKNTYKALQSDQYPRIIYNLEQISLRSQPQLPQMTATFDAVGRLSVAGATRTMPMTVTAEPLDDTQFRVSGQIAIKMTDFGIRPPTALFGMLKTGDALTIQFTWVLNRKTPMPHLPKYVAPTEQRQAITKVVLAYLQAENALAGSQLPQAKEALQAAADATQELAHLPAAALPEDAQKAWQEDIERLRASAAQTAEAEGLEAVRLAFRKLSQDAVTLVSDFGFMDLASNRPLFCYGCNCEDPQAKDKVWLQDTATADSPYEPTVRGHLSCGTPSAIYCP